MQESLETIWKGSFALQHSLKPVIFNEFSKLKSLATLKKQ